jgi:hypothetical protein
MHSLYTELQYGTEQIFEGECFCNISNREASIWRRQGKYT